MKKTFSLVLALCICLSLGAIFASCNTAHVHHIDTEWTKNETHHWHECLTCDDVSGKAEHNWDNGRITQAATEEADGIITFVCYVCKQTTTEPLPYKADDENTDNENDNTNNENGGQNTENPGTENTVATTVKDQAEWLKLFEIENCTIDAVLQIGEDPNNTGIIHMKQDGNRAITETSRANQIQTVYSLLKDNILYQGELVNGKVSYSKAAENISKLDIRFIINITVQEDFSQVTYDADKKAYISELPNEIHEIYVENGKIVKMISTIGGSMKGYATIEFSNFGTTVIENFPAFQFDS